MTRDQFITEVVLKECWHEWHKEYYRGQMILVCKCGKGYSECKKPHNPDFSTWEGFGKLWEFSKKQEWWQKFRLMTIGMDWERFATENISQVFISPITFADAVAKFHGYRGKEGGLR